MVSLSASNPAPEASALVDQPVAKLLYRRHGKRFPLKNDLSGLPTAALQIVSKVLGHIHPADYPIGSSNYEHDRIGLLLPVVSMARFLYLEDLLIITLPRAQVRIARLELKPNAFSGC